MRPLRKRLLLGLRKPEVHLCPEHLVHPHDTGPQPAAPASAPTPARRQSPPTSNSAHPRPGSASASPYALPARGPRTSASPRPHHPDAPRSSSGWPVSSASSGSAERQRALVRRDRIFCTPRPAPVLLQVCRIAHSCPHAPPTPAMAIAIAATALQPCKSSHNHH